MPLPRGHWRSLTLIAVISATLQYGLVFSGLAMIDATPAILLVQSEVVFGTIIAAIMLKELPTMRQLAGTCIALVGIVTIVGAPSLTGQMTGVALILTGCLCWALGQVMVRRLGDVMSGFQMTAWVGTIAAPQMLLASVLIEGDPLPALAAAPPFAWATVLYLGVVMTVVGYSAWYFLLSKYPVPMVMPVLLLLPISTIMGAVTFLGENPDPHVLLGGAIVVGGVSAVIVEPAQFRRLFRRSGG